MKRWILLSLCLVILICSSLSVSASSPKIVDDAGLLTEDEAAKLEEKARILADTYKMDVVIVTVWSLDGESSEAYADDYFDYNGYGIGDDHSGVLLLLSMEYRDWAISTTGKAIYALTDYGVHSVYSSISSYLSEDEYYIAFDSYLDALEPYFRAYDADDPIDGNVGSYDGPGTYVPGTKDEIVYYPQQSGLGQTVKQILIALVIGAVVASVVLLIMRSRMNTVKPQKGARSYMMPGSYSLNRQQDLFLYSQLRKVRRSENNSSSRGGHGGGSSVHRSSSGRSHGGGHGKF